MPALVTYAAVLTPLVLLVTAVLNFLAAYRKEAATPSARPRGLRRHARRLQDWRARRAHAAARVRAHALATRSPQRKS